jgi:hypothetical protein
MLTNLRFQLALSTAIAGILIVSSTLANGPATLTPTEQALQQSSTAGQFTYVLFYKDADAATQSLAGNLQQCAAQYPGQVALANVQVTNPAEQALVAKYGVARAPMPMALAIGPNGATTGVFRKDATPAVLANGIVPPTMLQCMKHLQEGKLVFVSVHSTPEPQVPAGVALFAGSPDFQNRTAFVAMAAGDTREAVLLGQMQVNPAAVKGTTCVLIAPPGVLVGQFNGASTPEQIGQAVHKAGKCCDDPNCKHNR